jgi:hypothetical protein
VLTHNAQFERELKQLITQTIEERKDTLSNGLAVVDYPAYKHHVGIIQGLRIALEMCDEATLAVERRKRN